MSDGKIIEKLLIYAQLNFGLSAYDVNYMRNLLLKSFGLSQPYLGELSDREITEIKGAVVADELFSECSAYGEKFLGYDGNAAERFATYIFGLLSPLPSKVNSRFAAIREGTGAKAACEYLYDLSVKNNYIQKTKLDKNVFFEYKKGKNRIELTINMAKPEKDNKEVAKLLKESVNNDYPKCQLCRENVGYAGTDSFPSRSNLRFVEVILNKENWFMQYSPFGYINEHCILISNEHIPMRMDGEIIDYLFDYIEYIPDYFVASNSDLPTIGGSILNHKHFQCGKKVMPMFEAKPIKELKSEYYPDVEIALTDWYCTDIRLSGYNRNTIKEVFSQIVDGWLTFSDEKSEIFNGVGDDRHNSATVVARYLEDGKYTVDIVLRNNAQNEKYPHGIYHVPPIYHNIKKEALGLMEVMGVFILPARLSRQISECARILCDKTYDIDSLSGENNDLFCHRFMVKEILEKQGYFKDDKKAEAAIREYIGQACIKMLERAGVYGKDSDSVFALMTFLSKFNIT